MDSIFYDDDGDDLIFSVALSGDPMSEWLHFYLDSRILSGILPKADKIRLQAIVADLSGDKCRCLERDG